MRIGEILLREGWVDPADLESALADQSVANKRVCSLLVMRSQLDPDHAARALAEQFGVAAALAKHLANRDQSLEKLLSPTIARRNFALPLGAMRNGEIVICVRDPKPQLQAAFEHVVNKPVLITVAAAHVLEPLIDTAYPPPPPSQDFGVRFGRPSTQPTMATTLSSSVVSQRARTNPPPAPPESAFAAGTHGAGRAPSELDVSLEADADDMPATLSLVDLDDAGVDKSDFSQAELKTPTTLPPGFGVTRAPTLPPANVSRAPTHKKP